MAFEIIKTACEPHMGSWRDCQLAIHASGNLVQDW
jgi:hypothetical protein